MAEMSDEKKARLEAIRAANAAKKAADDDAPAAPVAVPVTPAAPAVAQATTAAPAAVGASMSDEKKARLEAIRAAKKAAANDAPATPAAVGTPTVQLAATPVAATVAPAAPKPAAPAATKPAAPQLTGGVEANSIIDLSFKGTLIRIIAGAIFCGIIGLGLATLTDKYLLGGLFGVIIGVVGGYMVGDWPASKTTGD